MPQSELIARLKFRGIHTDDKKLAREIDGGYLPGRRARMTPSRTLARTTWLYRLRRLGIKGDPLRFFLFLEDGWGWERISSLCLTGLEKGADFALLGVGTAKHKKLTRKDLMDEIMSDEPAMMKRHRDRLSHYLPGEHVRDETIRTIVGTLLCGEPLQSKVFGLQGDFEESKAFGKLVVSDDETPSFQDFIKSLPSIFTKIAEDATKYHESSDKTNLEEVAKAPRQVQNALQYLSEDQISLFNSLGKKLAPISVQLTQEGSNSENTQAEFDGTSLCHAIQTALQGGPEEDTGFFQNFTESLAPILLHLGGDLSQRRADIENATPDQVEAARLELLRAWNYLRFRSRIARRTTKKSRSHQDKSTASKDITKKITEAQFLGLLMSFAISGTRSVERLKSVFFEGLHRYATNTQST